MDRKKTKPPTQLLLTDITLDPALRVREVDERVAEEYAEHLETLPPIILWDLDGRYVPVDGWHRLRAHQIGGAEYIRVIVMSGTREQAQLYLAQCDARVGLRRNRSAKRAAIRLVLGAQAAAAWSDRKIAAHTGTSHTLVAQVRAEVARGTKPDSAEMSGKIAAPESTEGEQTDGAEERANGKIATEAARQDRESTVGETEHPGHVAEVDARGGNLARQEGRPAGGDEDERPPRRAQEDADLEVGIASDRAFGILSGAGRPGVVDVIRLVETVLEDCADDDDRRDTLMHLSDTLSEMLAALESVVEEDDNPETESEAFDL